MCGVAGIVDFRGNKNKTDSVASMLRRFSLPGT